MTFVRLSSAGDEDHFHYNVQFRLGFYECNADESNSGSKKYFAYMTHMSGCVWRLIVCKLNSLRLRLLSSPSAIILFFAVVARIVILLRNFNRSRAAFSAVEVSIRRG